jgi:predicted CoA-binding protein
MKHMTRNEALVARVLDRARTIAIIGASPREQRHSHTVFAYLRRCGYDVVPVRADGRDVDGLHPYARIQDVPGAVDVAVVYRRADAAPAFVAAAAAKGVDAVWLPPGVWTREAQNEAERHSVVLIKDCCIEREHRHAMEESGHPRRRGGSTRRRRRVREDNRKDRPAGGYVENGGGGTRAGGGKHTVLDEKKMRSGRPSPRRGPYSVTR